ncbi:MAG: squalene/phytoene synthase family protein [Silvanigrellaceae bacterium]|nr:squalene/phytoene synthase family protein [Silvanigrellaceae bacterium]
MKSIANMFISDSLSYCHDILPRVSRTFAIGINALSGNLKKSVLVGYLLCRIADTIEDDKSLSVDEKILHFNHFLACFKTPHCIKEFPQIYARLNGDPWHIDLVKNTQHVFFVYQELSSHTKKNLEKWVTEMVDGMAMFTSRFPKGIRVYSLAEYKEYCYYVAGTVGFLLSELWLEYSWFIGKKTYAKLNFYAGVFGEALQTVNILKDISWDFHKENSIYLPLEELKKFGSSHENMFHEENIKQSDIVAKKFLDLAHTNLEKAKEYVLSLPRFSFRIRYFCILPLILAYATLRELKQSSSLLSPNSIVKISRREVKELASSSLMASVSNTYLKKLIEKVQFPS